MLKILFFLTLMLSNIYAIATVEVDANTKTLDLSHQVDYFIDTEQKYSFEDLPLDQFWPIGSDTLSVGYNNASLWIRLEIQNSLQEKFEGYLEIPSLAIEHLHFYVKEEDQTKELLSGTSHPFDTRMAHTNSFFLPLNLEQNASVQIYIEAYSQNSFVLAPRLHTRLYGDKHAAQSNFYNGILLGIFFAMLLYNFLIYLITKDQNSLRYSFYMLALSLFAGTFYGYNFQLLWPNDPALNADLHTAFLSFFCFTGLLFAKGFLNTRQYSKKTDRVITVFLYLLLGFTLVALFIGKNIYLHFIGLTLLTMYALALLWLTSQNRKQKVAGREYFFLATLFFFLALLFYILLPLGVIEYATLTYQLFGLILIAHILFFCIALRFHLRAREQQSDYAQNQTILQKELSKLITTDRLTELYTRKKLSEVLHLEIQRAKRFETDLGIILLDIDHFKLINDSFGHDLGDSILKEIAKLLQTHTRKIDTIGRWGDGKFLVICPGSNFEGLHSLAEKLRHTIAEFHFSTKQNHTASFGMTTLKHNDDNITQLISRVESAMNQAKDQGRNRIVSL